MTGEVAAGAMGDDELRALLHGRLDDAVDPAATLAAVPDAELARLADGLYRHLDTPSPAFGARFWYVQVTEELRLRRVRSSAPSSAAGIAPDDPVASGVPAG
ncbi:hypothetical protein ACFVTE_01740 [Arthrobacter sp. NPDC058097]|uniref:hypothetical protein n=1 Tax=Arthrobacter sp. NPDC058097 TaxID=3346340 RepID=UPI0036DB80EC